MPLNNISIQAVAGVIVFALLSAVISDSQMADDATAWFDNQYQQYMGPR